MMIQSQMMTNEGKGEISQRPSEVRLGEKGRGEMNP